MAVTYPTAVKTSRMTVVRDAVDAGGGVGKLELGTAGMATVLATFPLDVVSGTITNGVLTFSGFPKTDSAADNTGTAAAARVRAFNDTDVVTGMTVGTSGTDVIIDNPSITAGQAVTVTSFTITHAA